jgi:hypothetical protein
MMSLRPTPDFHQQRRREAFARSSEYRITIAQLEYTRWGLARVHAGKARLVGGDTGRFWFWVWDCCLANEIGWASR